MGKGYNTGEKPFNNNLALSLSIYLNHQGDTELCEVDYR